MPWWMFFNIRFVSVQSTYLHAYLYNSVYKFTQGSKYKHITILLFTEQREEENSNQSFPCHMHLS